MKTPKERIINILLIDDSSMDLMLTENILQKAKTPVVIQVASDGEKAIETLKDSTTPKPDIILLDINMPKKDGKETLQEIKRDEDLKMIPVIMLTSSESKKDVFDCYKAYANSYVLKPAKVEDHEKLLSALESFWFNMAVLPFD